MEYKIIMDNKEKESVFDGLDNTKEFKKVRPYLIEMNYQLAMFITLRNKGLDDMAKEKKKLFKFYVGNLIEIINGL